MFKQHEPNATSTTNRNGGSLSILKEKMRSKPSSCEANSAKSRKSVTPPRSAPSAIPVRVKSKQVRISSETVVKHQGSGDSDVDKPKDSKVSIGSDRDGTIFSGSCSNFLSELDVSCSSRCESNLRVNQRTVGTSYAHNDFGEILVKKVKFSMIQTFGLSSSSVRHQLLDQATEEAQLVQTLLLLTAKAFVEHQKAHADVKSWSLISQLLFLLWTAQNKWKSFRINKNSKIFKLFDFSSVLWRAGKGIKNHWLLRLALISAGNPKFLCWKQKQILFLRDREFQSYFSSV